VIGGRVLDSTALLDIADGSTVYGRALLDFAAQAGVVLAVPAAALTEAWAQASPAGQPFLELLMASPVVVGDDLSTDHAAVIGGLFPDRHASPDIVAGHTVHCAVTRSWPVVTADPNRLRAIRPDLPIEPLP
jgi:hypothetical protein